MGVPTKDPASTAAAPRRRRTQRATRAMILDATRAIARADGWPAVTIRRVADELGYTSPLIYEHFRDKADALAAVVHEGFAALAAVLAAAAARPLDPAAPDAYVRAVADAYVAFAHREPAVYQLMHGMGGVVLDPAETARGAALVCDVAVGALETWVAAVGVRLPDPLAATEVLWCALHGATCLALAGRLGSAAGAPPEDGLAHADALRRHAVDVLLAGWRAPPRAPQRAA